VATGLSSRGGCRDASLCAAGWRFRADPASFSFSKEYPPRGAYTHP
jgi:hypothetical protein